MPGYEAGSVHAALTGADITVGDPRQGTPEDPIIDVTAPGQASTALTRVQEPATTEDPTIYVNPHGQASTDLSSLPIYVNTRGDASGDLHQVEEQSTPYHESVLARANGSHEVAGVLDDIAARSSPYLPKQERLFNLGQDVRRH